MSHVARIAAIAAPLFLAACGATDRQDRFDLGQGSHSVLKGASVTENRTPVDEALVCYGAQLSTARSNQTPLGIAVGEIRDFTGRVTDGEGAPVTQGAGPMVYSALASVGRGIRVMERLDPRVADIELAYMDQQRLGDGRMHEASPGSEPAPWVPYMGGSVLRSDYYIVGGVTELNHSLVTGGAEATISGFGISTRFVVINVAVDLRIVNTRNLVVEYAVSMQKQVIGRETNGDIFRFFGTRLFDIKGGERMTEPVQMAVRSVLQLASLDLLEAVSGVPNEPCVREVQPDLERRQPRPQPPIDTRDWPPDAATAVSADRLRDMREDKDQSQAAAQSPPETPIANSQVPVATTDTGASIIGAATNAEAAAGLWKRLRDDHDDLFADVQADLVSVNREGGPFLVVVQHSRKAPEEFCEAATALNIECAVAPPQVLAARDAARKRAAPG